MKTSFSFITIAGFILIFNICGCDDDSSGRPGPSGPSTGSIYGTVTISGISDTGGTLVAAEMQLKGKNPAVSRNSKINPVNEKTAYGSNVYAAVSGRNGAYELKDLPEGIYTLYASKDNTLGAVYNNVQVKAGGKINVFDIELTATGSISGTALLDNQSENYYGTFVYAEGTSYAACTDESGGFHLSGIPVGIYNFVIFHDSYTPIKIEDVEVTASDMPMGLFSLQAALDITSFSFEISNNPDLLFDVSGVIEDSTINLEMPNGTDLTDLIASFKTTGIFAMVDGAIQLNGITSNDFSGSVTYTVVGEGGFSKDYSVIIAFIPSPAKEMLSFSFETANNPLLDKVVDADIDGTEINAVVPYGLDISSLVATFSSSGELVTVEGAAQESGVTVNDFRDMIVYTVTAEDGTTLDYNVNVIHGLNPAKEITSFSFESANNPVLSADAAGIIDGAEITVEVPGGTVLTSLAATFETTGDYVTVSGTLQESGVTENNFTGTVVYTVTAEDGTAQDYYVIVSEMAVGRWLYTSGNKIYTPYHEVWLGRGANLHDTRSCSACAYSEPNVDEVIRRADYLVDVWGANFIRLLLEAYQDSDGRVHWQNVIGDNDYLADIKQILDHLRGKPNVYVLVSLWVDPTFDTNGWPTEDTAALWRFLAGELMGYDNVLFGVVNEPQYNFDGSLDASCHAAMTQVVSAIREEEALAGSPQHIIVVQGTRAWGRNLDYYITNPITVYDGNNIAYETHVYNPQSDFESLFIRPSATLPVIIGEFGPVDGYMTLEDCGALIDTADSLEVPWLAWSFHQQCPPNLLVANENSCDGMVLEPTPWGELVMSKLSQ